jgi:hypothetical protein
MKPYQTVFGLANRLSVFWENGVYTWRVTIRGRELPEYSSTAIPDVNTLYEHFCDKLPNKTRRAATDDFACLRDSIKGSIRCLERMSKSKNRSGRDYQKPSC